MTGVVFKYESGSDEDISPESVSEFTGSISGEIAVIKLKEAAPLRSPELIRQIQVWVCPQLPIPHKASERDYFTIFCCYADIWGDPQQQIREVVQWVQDHGATLRQDWFQYGLHDLKWPNPRYANPDRDKPPS